MAQIDFHSKGDKVVTRKFKSILKIICLELGVLISMLFNLDVIVLLPHIRQLGVLIIVSFYVTPLSDSAVFLWPVSSLPSASSAGTNSHSFLEVSGAVSDILRWLGIFGTT